jgi:hypothetical protein
MHGTKNLKSICKSSIFNQVLRIPKFYYKVNSTKYGTLFHTVALLVNITNNGKEREASWRPIGGDQLFYCHSQAARKA